MLRFGPPQFDQIGHRLHRRLELKPRQTQELPLFVQTGGWSEHQSDQTENLLRSRFDQIGGWVKPPSDRKGGLLEPPFDRTGARE